MSEVNNIPATIGGAAVIEHTPKRGPSDIEPGHTGEIQVSGSSTAQVLRLLEEPPSTATIAAFEECMKFFGVEKWNDLENQSHQC